MWLSTIYPIFLGNKKFAEAVQATGRAKVTLMFFGVTEEGGQKKKKKRIFANQVMKIIPSESP